MSLEVAALHRAEKPGERSVDTVRRLLALVPEWPVGAGLDVTLGATVSSSKVRVLIDPIGPVPPGWRDDVRWALKRVARLKDAATRESAAPTSVVELRAERELAPALATADELPADLTALTALRREERMSTPWPTGRIDDLGALLPLLHADADLAVRFRLAAASSIEAEMVGDAVRATWPGDEIDVPAYVGRPVRVRALLGSRSGRLPARLRAVARRWASALRLVEHEGQDAARLWQGGADSLAGAAIPEYMALGVVRFPAAGTKPVVGVRSEQPKVAGRALERVPARPARPVRLGRARRLNGSWMTVRLDVPDLRRGCLILGATGTGKSVFERGVVRAIAERDDVSFSFLDPHGETARFIAEETPIGALERTRYVQFGLPDVVFGVNLIDCDPADLDRYADAFADLIADKDDPRGELVVGPRWKRTVGLVIAAVAARFGDRASLVIVAAILSDHGRIRRLAASIASTHPELSHRLDREVGAIEGKEATDLTSWATSKFHPLVASGRVRDIFGSASSFDLRAEIAAGHNLIFDLAAPTLGGAASTMVGATVIAEHALVMGHLDPDRIHVIFVDEVHRFGYGALPSLLAEGRKYGLPVFGATQDVAQLRGSLADSFEANVGTRGTLRTSLKAAMRQSATFDDWPASELARMPDLTAAFVMSRDGVPTEPFTLHLDHLDRMARRGPDADERAANARYLADRTRELFADPIVGRGPLTDVEIEEMLTARPARRSDLNGEVENWLAVRRAAAARTAARTMPDPSSAPR